MPLRVALLADFAVTPFLMLLETIVSHVSFVSTVEMPSM